MVVFDPLDVELDSDFDGADGVAGLPLLVLSAAAPEPLLAEAEPAESELPAAPLADPLRLSVR